MLNVFKKKLIINKNIINHYKNFIFNINIQKKKLKRVSFLQKYIITKVVLENN